MKVVLCRLLAGVGHVLGVGECPVVLQSPPSDFTFLKAPPSEAAKKKNNGEENALTESLYSVRFN